ncbi:MAG TPA: PHB depolymerase family esterase [Roseiarcus sp.]
MKIDFAEAMRLATLSTRANNVMNATKIILQAVSGRPEISDDDTASSDSPVDDLKVHPTLRLIERDPEREKDSREGQPASGTPTSARAVAGFRPLERSARARKPMGEVLRTLREGPLASPGFLDAKHATKPPAVPEGAQFLTRSFTCAAGTRDYKLYIPASAPDAPRGLIVMLHGCKQDPNDFAVGTNMNAIAESRGLLVAYPSQARSANASSCWNWFNPADQFRNAGEPSIIAGLTRDIVSAFGLDRRSVFVAGLSAGGAMAAVMGETYPDLFAAVGVHSGLAYGSANDVMSAFAAMRGPAEISSTERLNVASDERPRVRTIVFHGARDRTVHPANADRIVEVARSQLEIEPHRLDSKGVAGARQYTSTAFFDSDGVPVVELWRITGAGHAWSGGNPNGSFADSKGPDASAEMVRFFLADAR